MLVGMLALRGNDGVDTDHALATADGVDSAMNLEQCFSKGVADLVKRNQPDGFLISDPLERHSGYVSA